jgi:DNA-directed RNA polymerase subunit RPC12/RpoP
MKKRFTFQCWNCQETYTLFREITKGQVIIVACPYCNREAVFDPSPYPKKKEIVALRGEGDTEREIEELDLPDVLPTQKKSADE